MRKLLIVCGLLLAAGLGWLAVLLVPGHLQIRDVDPQFPTPGDLEAFFRGVAAGAGPRSIAFVNTATQTSASLTISHVAVVLEWPDGRMLLVDTGMDATSARAFGEPFELLLGAEPTRTFGAVTEQLGEAARAIGGVVFTHLHSDHTQGITDLCRVAGGATVFQTRQQATLHNLHTEAGQELVSGSGCRRELLAPDLVGAVPGFPGIGAVAAGGHTPGSTVYVARVGDETWIFAGDLSNSLADVLDDRGKGSLYSYLLIPEDESVLTRWRAWLREARAAGRHVVVAHDLASYLDGGLKPWGAGP